MFEIILNAIVYGMFVVVTVWGLGFVAHVISGHKSTPKKKHLAGEKAPNNGNM